MELAEALEYLDRHPRRSRVGAPGPVVSALGSPPDALGSVLDALGNPQHAYPVILVAGSVGSSTVTRLIGAILAATGLTTGTLVSADLERPGDRVARNGEVMADAELADILGAVAHLEALVSPDLSWSEVLAAAALGWFAQVAVDVAVIEVGSAGTDDAPARVAPAVTVVAASDPAAVGRLIDWVPRDAVAVLGDPDEESRAVVATRGPAELIQRDVELDVSENLAAVGGRVVDLRTPHGRYQELFVPLHGAASGDAAGLAVAAAEAFFARPLDPDLVAEGLATAVDPGHFEVVGRGPLVVVDVAADPEALQRVAAIWRQDFEVSGRRLLVIGASVSAEVTDLLDAVEAVSFDEVIVTRAPGPDALDARVLAAAAEALGIDPMVVADVEDAVDGARVASTPDDAILITGSPRVVGAARAKLA